MKQYHYTIDRNSINAQFAKEIFSPYYKDAKSLQQCWSKAVRLSSSLDSQLVEAVKGFKASREDGVLFKSLFRYDGLIATPSVKKNDDIKADFISEYLMLSVASLIGDAYGYAQEANGSIIQNLYPTPGNQNKQSSDSSDVLLEFHTETVFHPFAPDYLMLMCLRQDADQEAETIISSLDDVLSKGLLDEETILLLREPLYRTGVDLSFGERFGQKGKGPLMPCIYGDPASPMMSFDLDLMVGINDRAQAALDRLAVALKSQSKGIKLDAGDMVILNNRKVVHARSKFKAYFDGRDRWLQRCFISNDIQRAEILFSDQSRIISFDKFYEVESIRYAV